VPLYNKTAFSHIKLRSSRLKETPVYKTVAHNHLQIIHFGTQAKYGISVGKVYDRLRYLVCTLLVLSLRRRISHSNVAGANNIASLRFSQGCSSGLRPVSSLDVSTLED
jgi:hypothetical protein